MTYSSHAIVLGRRDVREHDRLFVLYTREFGKEEAVATGVRKIVSKLAPHLTPLSVVDCMFARGKHVERLIQATALERFHFLHNDLQALSVASMCAEMVDHLTRPGVKDQRVYDLLLQVFRMLDERVAVDFDLFSLRLLHLLGMGLEFSRCVRCRIRLQEAPAQFCVTLIPTFIGVDPIEGGIVCLKCRTNAALLFQSATLAHIEASVQGGGLVSCVAHDEQQTIATLAKRYRSAHLEWELKSTKFYDILYQGCVTV